MAKRPFLLRCLPPRLRLSVWARYYCPTNPRWKSLYEAAPLAFAPPTMMSLVMGDVISDSIAFTGIYELGHTRDLVAQARRGGAMIDVGANLGYFTLLWLASHPGNLCHAIEASPRNLPLLTANVSRNDFTSRVTILDKAAGRERGTLPFTVGSSVQTGWGGFSSANGDGNSTMTVDVIRLDELTGLPDEIAYLKIDVEGADTWVLIGAERLLTERRVRHIRWEQNKPRMRQLGIADDEAAKFLKSVGYKATPLSYPNGDMVEWEAVPPS